MGDAGNALFGVGITRRLFSSIRIHQLIVTTSAADALALSLSRRGPAPITTD